MVSKPDLVVVCDFWILVPDQINKMLFDHLGHKNHYERALSSWLCHLSKVGRISIFLVKMHIKGGRGGEEDVCTI